MAVGQFHHAAEADADAAPHRLLERELRLDPMLCCQPRDRSEHRVGAAREHARIGLPRGQTARERGGDEAGLAAATVVGGEDDRASGRARRSATPLHFEQLLGGVGAEVDIEADAAAGQHLGGEQHGRQADPAGGERERVLRRREVEAVAERRKEAELGAQRRMPQQRGTLADLLDEQLHPGRPACPCQARQREGAAQEGVEAARARQHPKLARRCFERLGRGEGDAEAGGGKLGAAGNLYGEVASRYHALAIMRHLRRFGHCLAAGALAGLLLTPLQLLLWPQVQLDALKLALALVAFVSWATVWIGGALFVLAEVAAVPMPYLAGRPGFSLGLWRWLTVVAGLLVASTAWYNRQATRDLLDPEARHALAVAASLVTLYTLVTLAQAIRRRARRHARARVLTAGAGLILAVWGVWAMTSSPEPAPPTGELPHYEASHRLLLVCWEGADLSWVLPAIDRGDMPFLRSQRDLAAWGQVRAIRPFVRSVALASLVTACSPAVHGVLGESAYRIEWITGQPVELLLTGPWRTPQQLPWKSWEHAPAPAPQRAPLWQILRGAGMDVGVAGWPAWDGATWTVPAPRAAALRAEAVLDADFRAGLDPLLRNEPGLAGATRTAFAAAVATTSRALQQMQRMPVMALVVDLDLAARLRPMWTTDDPRSAAEEVLRQAARVLDDHLHALWRAVGGNDTLLVVTSPYGMAAPSQWERLVHLGGEPVTWRVSPSDSPDGFALFCGPGVRGGARLRGARVTDVVATILYLLELPVARDMAGRVMLETVSDDRAAAVPLRLVPSYPAVPAAALAKNGT